MEFAAGFDMVPRLTKSSTDQAEWDRFIQSVKTFYNNDGVVNVKSASIVFNISGHPSLPLQCEKFLRFSARTTGAHFDNAQEYISMVCEMATAVFGARIHLWVEGDEASSLAAKPHYGLSEVLESQKAYEQVCSSLQSLLLSRHQLIISLERRARDRANLRAAGNRNNRRL